MAYLVCVDVVSVKFTVYCIHIILYSMLQLIKDAEEVMMVKMMSPWGENEWRGPWSNQ